MSAYIVLSTPMTDQRCLVEALGDLGFGRDKVEIHAEPVALVGYEGSGRSQVANVVIRRNHVGRSSNDIGFLETRTGYRALISDFDAGSSGYGPGWVKKLQERYQARKAEHDRSLAAADRKREERTREELVEAQRETIYQRARKMRYQVNEHREEDKIRLLLVKRSY